MNTALAIVREERRIHKIAYDFMITRDNLFAPSLKHWFSIENMGYIHSLYSFATVLHLFMAFRWGGGGIRFRIFSEPRTISQSHRFHTEYGITE